MKNWIRLVLVTSAAAATVLTAHAQMEKPFSTAVLSIGNALTKIAATSASAPVKDNEVKALTRNCHSALTALAKDIGDHVVSEDYVKDLTMANTVLASIAAKTTITTEEIVRIRAVSDDIHAKRRWAEKHKDVPAGPVTLEVATAKGKSPVGVFDVWSRSAIDEHTEPVQPAKVDGEPHKISLRPGNYYLWLRSRGDAPKDGATKQFAADGAPERVELKVP
jgi:hypothetical protein